MNVRNYTRIGSDISGNTAMIYCYSNFRINNCLLLLK